MLEGCVPWPADLAARYRARGWWEGITISQLLARSAARHPDKTALVCADQRLRYRELAEISDRLACGFLEAGIEPLDRVVLQLPNFPSAPVPASRWRTRSPSPRPCTNKAACAKRSSVSRSCACRR